MTASIAGSARRGSSQAASVLAVHAQPEAGERDAQLRGRDEAILFDRGRQQSQHAREPIARRRAMLDGCSRHADDRELGGDEQRVRQQEAGE